MKSISPFSDGQIGTGFANLMGFTTIGIYGRIFLCASMTINTVGSDMRWVSVF